MVLPGVRGALPGWCPLCPQRCLGTHLEGNPRSTDRTGASTATSLDAGRTVSVPSPMRASSSTPPRKSKYLAGGIQNDSVGAAPLATWLNGDGPEGLVEGFSSSIFADGSQPIRWNLRADCIGEASFPLALASSHGSPWRRDTGRVGIGTRAESRRGGRAPRWSGWIHPPRAISALTRGSVSCRTPANYRGNSRGA